MFVCIIFGSTCLQNALNSWGGVTGTDVMTEKQVGVTIVFLFDPAGSGHQSKGVVRVVGTKLPDRKPR